MRIRIYTHDRASYAAAKLIAHCRNGDLVELLDHAGYTTVERHTEDELHLSIMWAHIGTENPLFGTSGSLILALAKSMMGYNAPAFPTLWAVASAMDSGNAKVVTDAFAHLMTGDLTTDSAKGVEFETDSPHWPTVTKSTSYHGNES